jgi:iron(III) transport system ATP-binding protein
MAELAITGLGLRRRNRDILKGVSLTVPSGKILALLGPSGSGKTALLRAIAGLDLPWAGAIRIGDRVLFEAAERTAVRAPERGVGLMFQSNALWPRWTVSDNLAFCLKHSAAGADTALVGARVSKLLAEFGLRESAERTPPQLSAAERLRLALARAVIAEPAVLLLDDPLAGLDPWRRDETRAWLRQFIAKLGTTILVTTTDQDEALSLADRLALIKDGAIEQEGTPTELYTQPQTLFAAEFIGHNNRIEGPLIEKAGSRAFIEVMGNRIGGLAHTQAELGERATGIIRLERIRIGGGPGLNRIPMRLSTQMYLGERWELVFASEALTVRAYASAPLRHEAYHIEFPPDALWLF